MKRIHGGFKVGIQGGKCENVKLCPSVKKKSRVFITFERLNCGDVQRDLGPCTKYKTIKM